MNKIDKALDGCVQSLRHDPEMALDVRRELAGHLEERMDEGMSEEEALKHFGDPGEIGSGLLLANFRRLKFRARLRLILMILAIPAILTALYFAINFRFWAGVANRQELIRTAPPTSPTILSQLVWQPLFRIAAHVEPEHSPEDRLIIFGDSARGETPEISAEGNAQQAIRDAYPENKVYYAHATLYAVAEGKTPEFQIAQLENARKFEPENGFYDFLLAGVLLNDALKINLNNATKINVPPDQKSPITIEIADRDRLDRAMKIFQQALTKPYVHSYIGEMAAERIARLKLEGDFFSEMQRLTHNAGILLPHLKYYRNLGRAITFYGETLIQEGKPAEGEFFLEAWKPFVRKIAADDMTLIGLLVDGAIIRNQQTVARLPVPEKRLRELEQAVAPVEKIRRGNTGSLSRTSPMSGAGILASMLIPGLAVEPSAADLEPERRLNYVLADGIVLMLLNLIGLAVMTGYAVALLWLFMRNQTGFLLTFSRRDYFRITLWGVAIPLAAFFGLMEFTPLGGRMSPLSNPAGTQRMLGEAVFFLVAVPMPFLILWYRACRRRGRELGFEKLPRAVAYCNMLAGWAVMLIVFTALVRPGLSFGEQYWISKDQLIFRAKTFTQVEDQLIRKVRAELLDAIPE